MPASYERKDLLLLQKYKDENFKKALVDGILSLTKAQVILASMKGETSIRVQAPWAESKAQAEEYQKEEQLIREGLEAIFPGSKIMVDANHINLLVYEFWELIVVISWT
jgi:hypothetical protein